MLHNPTLLLQLLAPPVQHHISPCATLGFEDIQPKLGKWRVDYTDRPMAV